MITTTEGRERTYHLWYDHYNRREGREPITCGMITTTEGGERTYHLWYDHYNRREGENLSPVV